MEDIKAVKLNNIDEMFGFVAGKCTHDAYNRLSTYIHGGNKKCMFLDFKKACRQAYNCLDRDKLLNILKAKVDEETLEVIRQAITNQNIVTLDQNIRCTTGVAQGSAWAPLFFNIYLDHVIDKIKEVLPSLKVICYADDIVLLGQYEFKLVKRMFSDFGLIINTKKSATFGYRTYELPYRKTYMYLGAKIKDNGDAYGITAVAKRMKSKAKNIAKLSNLNSLYGYKIAESVIGGMFKFYNMRMKMTTPYMQAMKTAMRLPRSLPHGDLERAIKFINQEETQKNERIRSSIKLLKNHVTKLGEGKRYSTPVTKWSITMIEKELKMIEMSRKEKYSV